jgi:MFS family permease
LCANAGLIASASVMGSLLGVLLSWTPFGRKRPLTLAAMIGMAAAGFMLWSPNVWVLIAARFLAGYGVGIGVIQGGGPRAIAVAVGGVRWHADSAAGVGGAGQCHSSCPSVRRRRGGARW